ncbi:MAG: hypothetical protein JNM70_09835 [Anaerolineae bacterium]|nr:hypothetical protein [Anaerolineae bacterium]
MQHFWHNAAYMRGLCRKIAVLPLLQLPPFVPIRPSDTDDISDNSLEGRDALATDSQQLQLQQLQHLFHAASFCNRLIISHIQLSPGLL